MTKRTFGWLNGRKWRYSTSLNIDQGVNEPGIHVQPFPMNFSSSLFIIGFQRRKIISRNEFNLLHNSIQKKTVSISFQNVHTTSIVCDDARKNLDHGLLYDESGEGERIVSNKSQITILNHFFVEFIFFWLSSRTGLVPQKRLIWALYNVMVGTFSHFSSFYEGNRLKTVKFELRHVSFLCLGPLITPISLWTLHSYSPESITCGISYNIIALLDLLPFLHVKHTEHKLENTHN